MSNELTLRQRRYTASLEGRTYYSIDVTALAGSNPSSVDRPMDNHVFVQKLGDVAANDTFARIATISDMDLVPSFREHSVANNLTEYRTASTTLRFTDLDTAIAAIHVLRDRVNNLVEVYATAVRDFITPSPNTDFPDAFPLPLTVETLSVKQGLINSYTAARDSRLAEESDMEIAQEDYEAKLLAFQCETEKKDIHCEYQSKLSNLSSKSGSLASGILGGVQALENAAEAASRSKVYKYSSDSAVSHTWTTSQVSSANLVANASGVAAGDLVEVSHNGATYLRAITSLGGNIINFAPPLNPAPAAGTQFKVYSIIGAFSFSDSGQLAGRAAALRTTYDAYIAGDNSFNVLLGTHASAATTECNAAQATTNTTWSEAESAKELLQSREAEVAKAQKVETEATAELLAYCPTIDLSTL